MYACVTFARQDLRMDVRSMKLRKRGSTVSFALRRDGRDLVLVSEVILLKGVAGSAKSRLAVNVIKGFLTGDDNGLGFEYAVTEDPVLYISTEMSSDTLDVRWEDFREYFQLDGDSVIIADIRRDLTTSSRIFEDVIALIRSQKWGAVVIDQFGDLVSSVNGEIEGNIRLRQIVELADELRTPLILVLHQNEGSDAQSKARGHLGSILEQKAALSISILNSRGLLKIASTKIRSGSHFEQWAEPHYEAQILRGVDRNLDVSEFDLSEIGDGCTLGVLKEILARQKKVKVESIRKEPGELVKAGLLIEEKRGKEKFYSRPTTLQLYGSS